MRIVLACLFILAAYKWSDWRDWRKYYPTILFMICCSLFETVITYNHKLWILLHIPSSIPVFNNFFITFTIFPATMLLYLSHFPYKISHRIYYMLAWVLLYSLIEVGMGARGLVTYNNGWSLAWSALFNCVMFPILWVHHFIHPLLAWMISAVFFAIIWSHFGFSAVMLL